MEQFNLQKVTYRTYIGLIILPINIILFYYDTISRNIHNNYFYYFDNQYINIFDFNKRYQNLIFSKMFYFILYLCALEIAPIFFMFLCLKGRLENVKI
jgi:hypothetical protein